MQQYEDYDVNVWCTFPILHCQDFTIKFWVGKRPMQPLPHIVCAKPTFFSLVLIPPCSQTAHSCSLLHPLPLLLRQGSPLDRGLPRSAGACCSFHLRSGLLNENDRRSSWVQPDQLAAALLPPQLTIRRFWTLAAAPETLVWSSPASSCFKSASCGWINIRTLRLRCTAPLSKRGRRHVCALRLNFHFKGHLRLSLLQQQKVGGVVTEVL